ncbi:MAG TPA: SMP-30/gluconolactonase/LRE family protein [Mycobacteriales bacterium]|nr:SMP-30/gluconolactonase/LRE family protein [Mycobacteriales bacterium]
MAQVQTWDAEPAGSVTARLGEGPHWDARRGLLSWVDIPAGRLWVEQGASVQHLDLGAALGVAVPHEQGGWVCGLGRGVALVDDAGSLLEHVQLEPAGVRMNDGKCDARGRFFVGSKADDNTTGAGSLWRLDLDGSVHRVLSGLTIANGLGWSPDGSTMYVTDSAAARITAHAYDEESGELGPARPFVELPGDVGAPDGLAVDAEGFVWTAVWGGHQVRRHAPSGELVGVVRVPASHVTSCAFSGPDLTTLAVTTAWDELPDEQRAQEPLAGRRFSADVGIRGRQGEPCRVVRSGWTAAG